jgi:hypothetical protein
MREKPDFEVKWDPKAGEYVARAPVFLDVSCHSRHPGAAFVLLLRKLLELGLVKEEDWR